MKEEKKERKRERGGVRWKWWKHFCLSKFVLYLKKKGDSVEIFGRDILKYVIIIHMSNLLRLKS